MRATYRKLFSILILWAVYIPAQAQDTLVLHAHNDYTRKRPLYQALEQGIQSIEIDLYYRRGRVVVSHIPLFLGAKKDLESLYGKRLQAAAAEKKLPPRLTLMADIKAGHDSTTFYALKSLQSCTENIKDTEFRILLTGSYNRQQAGAFPGMQIEFDASLYAFLQGEAIPAQCGRLSCSRGAFARALQVLGKEKVKARLREAAAMHIETRIWGAGNRPGTWKRLADMGICIINCDRYARARHFLSQYP